MSAPTLKGNYQGFLVGSIREGGAPIAKDSA
jgi:hypothetical protein